MADMSPEAVTARLRRASGLASLCVKLGKATPEPPDDPPAEQSEDTAVRESPPRYDDE